MISRIMKKILSSIGIITGGIIALFGVLGILGLCCIPLVLGFLGLFGLSSAMIMKNGWLLALGGILIVAAVIVYYFKRCRC